MIEQASLVIGECNWAVKEGSLLGYKLIDGKYYPREMDVVRATTGTRVNSAGLVELVPYNLFSWSEDFTNAAWTNNAFTLLSGQSDPFGGNKAFKATSTSAVQADLRQAISGAGVFGVYAKAGNFSTLKLWNGTAGVSFNLTNGTATSGGTIVNVGDGWYRCSILTPTTGSFTAIPYITGAIGDYIYLAFAQANEGTTLKDYQKTETRLNIPRLDYSNGTCPSLLVEPQRTNLQTYSEDLSQVGAENGSVTTNVTTSPSGIQNADLYTENTTTSYHRLNNGVLTYVNGQSYTFSVYAKANGTGRYLVINAESAFNARTFFDLNNGTIALTDVGTASIESVGNGWYRCSVTNSRVYGTGADSMYFGLSTGLTDSAYTGNGTTGFYAWGMQIETGAYQTSYIPTTSASVTRNADVISKTGISSLIGQTEGTLFWEGTGVTQGGTDDLWLLGTFVNDSSVAVLLYYIHSTASVSCYINNGSSFVLLDAPMTITNNNKVAIGYKNGDYVMYVNGVAVDSSTSAIAPPSGMNQVAMNKWQGVTGVQKQQMKAAALWKTRLTNAQLQQLSSI